MIINQNSSALYAHRQFKLNASKMNSSIEKLSSGKRINRGLDDPTGLAVSEKMRSQVRGLRVASRNAQDGISFLQTAEGWLASTTDILQRMRELAIQTSNGIYTKEDRKQVQTEIAQLVDEIDRIASQAEFNGMKLLKGGFQNPNEINSNATTQTAQNNPLVNKPDGGLALHIGANMDQRERVFINNVSADALGIATGEGKNRKLNLDYNSQDSSNEAIGKIDKALNIVNKQRADLGAYQSRMETSARGIDIARENLVAAESRIRDTDMALESINYIKSKILTETSATMLAQANMKPLIVRRLLDNINM